MVEPPDKLYQPQQLGGLVEDFPISNEGDNPADFQAKTPVNILYGIDPSVGTASLSTRGPHCTAGHVSTTFQVQAEMI